MALKTLMISDLLFARFMLPALMALFCESGTRLAQAPAFYQQGLIVTTAAKAASSVSLFKADLTKPLFVLVGGERRGVTRSFLHQEDLLLEIPYAMAFKPSLGSVSAVTVLEYEVIRQRGGSAPGGIVSDSCANN